MICSGLVDGRPVGVRPSRGTQVPMPRVCSRCGRVAPPAGSTEILGWKGLGELDMIGGDLSHVPSEGIVCDECATGEADDSPPSG